MEREKISISQQATNFLLRLLLRFFQKPSSLHNFRRSICSQLFHFSPQILKNVLIFDIHMTPFIANCMRDASLFTGIINFWSIVRNKWNNMWINKNHSAVSAQFSLVFFPSNTKSNNMVLNTQLPNLHMFSSPVIDDVPRFCFTFLFKVLSDLRHPLRVVGQHYTLLRPSASLFFGASIRTFPLSEAQIALIEFLMSFKLFVRRQVNLWVISRSSRVWELPDAHSR